MRTAPGQAPPAATPDSNNRVDPSPYYPVFGRRMVMISYARPLPNVVKADGGHSHAVSNAATTGRARGREGAHRARISGSIEPGRRTEAARAHLRRSRSLPAGTPALRASGKG